MLDLFILIFIFHLRLGYHSTLRTRAPHPVQRHLVLQWLAWEGLASPCQVGAAMSQMDRLQLPAFLLVPSSLLLE